MSRSRRYGHWPLVVCTISLLTAFSTVSPISQATTEPSPEQVVQRAWRHAQECGVYRFTTEIVQTTYPAPMLSNVGRSSRQDTLYLEGETNLPARKLQLVLWNGGGSLLNGRDSVELRVEGDRTYGRTMGGEWEEMPDFSNAFAPANDLMAYLAGAENVQRAPSEAEREGALRYTRYSYQVDGPAFAGYVRDQMERYLIQKGELPVGLSLDTSQVYRGVTGQGEIWIDDDQGLPLRLSVHLVYPVEQSGERVEADIKTDFSGFSPVTRAENPVGRLASTLLPRDRKQVGTQVGLFLGCASLLFLLVTQGRSKKVYAAVVLTLVVTMVVTPLLNHLKAAAFFQSQATRQTEHDQRLEEQDAARQAQEELATSDWDPHLNPLYAGETFEGSEESPVVSNAEFPRNASTIQQDSVLGSPTCTVEEENADSDQDGLNDCDEQTVYLTESGRDCLDLPSSEKGACLEQAADSDGDNLLDGWEVLRLGTAPTVEAGFDSDGDGISDYLEVVGFAYRGKTWYSDPNNPDTDKDNTPDSVECPERENVDGTWVDPLTTCRDTDDDGIPDMFDLDSDNDSVPDKVDLSPLSVLGGAAPFDRANPFSLLVNNLTSKAGNPQEYYPVLVDFQLRTVITDHLTYALNVLDWPSGDESGQIKRWRDNTSTFADFMTDEEREADPRAENGDVRLIPMLEIEMTGNNIPLPVTNPQTSLQWRGDISGTVQVAQSGEDVLFDFENWTGRSQRYYFTIYTGTCTTVAGEWFGPFSVGAGDSSYVIRDRSLLDIADGQHAIWVSDGSIDGGKAACALIGDIPNGGYTDKMIAPGPLAAYGVSVRDKDNAGTLLAYVPLNVVPDDTGGGRVAFSARTLYLPVGNNLGDMAQQVRMVWLVQILNDWCEPVPDDLSDEEAQAWCESSTNWSLDNTQIIHTYDDAWYLTGLAVREDHGLNVAISWEDPAAKTSEQRKYDDWLWVLARGLEDAFISGRDQDNDGVRDLGLFTQTAGITIAETTLADRFDSPVAGSITITDRLGIPLTATLHVETFSYPTQDYVAHIMMTETVKVLQDNFDAYPQTTPTLLFAREELYRTVSLDLEDARSITGSTAAFDLNGIDVKVIAAMNWTPYRYRNGAWHAYPLEEYWDLMGMRFKDVFPSDLDLPDEVNRDIIAGQVLVARAYYLSMNQGRVGLVQIGDITLYQYDARQTDESLAMTLAETVAQKGARTAKGIYMVTRLIAENVMKIFPTIMAEIRLSASISKGIAAWLAPSPTKMFFMAIGRCIRQGIAKGVRGALSGLKGLLNTLSNKLYGTSPGAGRVIGVSAALALAAVVVVASIVAGFVYGETALMVQVCITTVMAVAMVGLAIKTIYDVYAAAQALKAAEGALKLSRLVSSELQSLSKAAVACAVIGLVIGVLVAFGGFIAVMVIGHLKAGSLAANAAFAEAVAYTVVAVIMFAISLIPVVGQIIAAVIAAIDALISAICAVVSAASGGDVSQRAGGWACKGLSGFAAEIIKELIYDATFLVDLTDPNRLQFGPFDYDLVQFESGLAVGNQVKYTANLTNTLKLVPVVPPTEEMKQGWISGTMLLPVNWMSLSYAWQFSDSNLKSSTFRYLWQTAADDIHDGLEPDQSDKLERNQMNNDWLPSTESHTFYITPTVASDGIPLDEAGINHRPSLYLSEGYAVPVQECFVVPNLVNPMCVATPYVPYLCLVPVCHVRTERATINMNVGDRFILDIFPATLEDFYRPVGKDGGYSLAWGQNVVITSTALGGAALTFPRQKDFDGDGLPNVADRGSDPDDSRWDTDGDGLSDYFESQHGSHPSFFDTDGDGLNDADEMRAGTAPTRKDTDGDGLTDWEEVRGWAIVYAFADDGSQLRTWATSDPLDPDEDDDGLTDFREKTYGFNPRCKSDPNVLALQSSAEEINAPRLLLRFEEEAGVENFADTSGYGKVATCTGDACPASVYGRYGYALQFGGDDVLSIAHSEVNTLRNGLTAAAWIRPTQLSGGRRIVATARTMSNNGFGLGTIDTDLVFTTFGVKSYRLTGAGLQTDRWTHVAAVMGSNNNVTFYVDGVNQGTVAHNAPANADTDDDLLVGATTFANSATLSERFHGAIDEVAVFDRVLSPEEVATLMAARYNPNDLFVLPDDTLYYEAEVTNKLYDRYAQGLLSVTTTVPSTLIQDLPPRTFVLQPLEQEALSGNVQVSDISASGAFSLTQVAHALITDWREQSDFAEMWLPLNDPITTTFLDYSGSIPPRNGSCSGSSCPARQEPGYFDYSLGFDGSQYVTLPDAEELSLKDNSFSVSAWIKGSDFSGSGATNDRSILGTDSGGANRTLHLVVRNRKPYMGFGNNDLDSGYTLSANTWYHVVFCYDKDKGQQSIYVNGDLRDSRTGAAAFQGDGTVYLGRARGDYGFRGWIDDVRVFGRALTIGEIRVLYNKPVLRMQFEESNRYSAPTPTYFADVSGFGNSGVCYGGDCPAVTDGIFGQRGVSFSGDDHLSVASSSSLNLSDGQFTIAAWVRPAAGTGNHPQGILGRYEGRADTGLETSGTEKYSYPTLLRIGGKIRFGYGTGSAWVSRTTADAVLSTGVWSHVVLAFGPTYETDGSFDQYRAVLYVNNEVKADWALGSAAPYWWSGRDVFVGRASTKGTVYVDRFTITNKADESGHCEIYLKWDGERICTSTGTEQDDECRWGSLEADSNVDVNWPTAFAESAKLEAWEADDGFEAGHNYGDDPLCDVGSSNCTGQGYTFDSDQKSIQSLTLDWQGDDKSTNDGLNHEDLTRISLYLGDGNHLAYYNPSVPFHGEMDELVMYKRPLSADEVQELYLSGSTALRLRLDDPPGNKSFENAVDVSQQSNAFCVGDACPTAGVSGRDNQAALFDGLDDVLDTSLTFEQASDSAGVTMMAWVYPKSASSGQHHVLSSDNGGYDWSLLREGGTWRVFDGQGIVSTGAAVDANRWQHVAVVFEPGPGKGITFYKDGAPVNGAPLALYYQTSSDSVAVGAKPGGGGYFDGIIDDVRIFNRPLSSADIETIFKSAPLLQLHLDEHEGATTFTNAAGGDDGTCSGAACPQADTRGQVGLAVDFNGTSDGTQDVITVPDSDALDLPSFTVGTWVMPTAVVAHDQMLVGKGSNYRLYIPARGMTVTVELAPDCGAIQRAYSVAPLVQNQWNHVMGTYDGQTLRVYVNGYEQGSLPVTGAACSNSDALRIGGGSATEAFAGRLDEVTLYDHALTPFEVRDTFLYQGKLVEERRGNWVTVDIDVPQSLLRSYTPTLPYMADQGVLMHVEAQDPTSGVSLVELGVDGTYTGAPRCGDAEGDAASLTAWCPFFQPSGEGAYDLTTRATDLVGNRETPARTYRLYVDGTPPQVGNALSGGNMISALPHPTRQTHWLVHLGGTIGDPPIPGGVAGSGVQADGVKVTLLAPQGAPVGEAGQPATIAGNTWAVDYVLDQARPTGAYTVSVRAADRVGNQSTTDLPVRIQVDATAPAADLDSRGVAATHIVDTLPLQGVVSEAPAPKHTVLHLHLEEDAGSTAFYDSSGEGHHGVCAGATCPTAGAIGKYGRALRFDGADEVVTITHSAINERRSDFSVAAWINPAQLSGNQRVIATARTSSADDGFAFGTVSTDVLFETFGVKAYRFTGAALQLNSWTHVAAVMDGDNAVTFYVDGVARTTITHTLPANADADDALLIGATTLRNSATRIQQFAGRVDEVVVVQRALSADEVRALAQPQTVGVDGAQIAFRSTLPGSPFYNEKPQAGLVLHLPLDDSPNITDTLRFRDIASQGSASHGSAGQGLTGTCSGERCPDHSQPGHIGNAAGFDGQQDHIALNNFGTFTTTTVSAWVYRTGETGARETVLSYKEQGDCGFVLSLNEDVLHHYPRMAVRVGSGWTFAEQATSIPPNTWVHLAATYDGQTIRLYRDAQEVASVAAPGGMQQCSAASSVGSHSSGDAGVFSGSIDDVRVYAHALSAAEIKTLFLGSGPVLALPFDEKWAVDGGILPDASGWVHDGTLYTGLADATNKAVPGQVGLYTLQLDGVDDYVGVGPHAGLDLSGSGSDEAAFTQAAWVYTPPDNGLYPIISSAAYTQAHYEYPSLQVVNRTQVNAGFGDGSDLITFTTGSLLTNDAWNHVAATFNGVTYTIYVNGAPGASTDLFKGSRPAPMQRFDVGRGSYASNPTCARVAQMSLVAHSWVPRHRIKFSGAVVMEVIYPTPEVAYDISVGDFCGSGQIEVEYWSDAAWTWVPLGAHVLGPTPGTGDRTFTDSAVSATVAWDVTAAPAGLRHFAGRLDDVRIYQRALSPLEVRALYQGGWQAASVSSRGAGVDLADWAAQVPAGMEGSYELDLRGQDVAGHADATGLSQRLWRGEVDTLAPRVAITRTTVGAQYRYTTVAEDYNLLHGGFSSPCGAGVATATEYFQSPWYQALASAAAPGQQRLYRLTADCYASATGLFETGVWAELPWIDGGFVISGSDAYVPAGPLWKVDVSNPAMPRFHDVYDTTGDARGVAISGARAYVADGVQGLSVVDLTDPSAAPARQDTPGQALDAAFYGNYAYVADGAGGLRVMDVSDPADPREVGHYGVPGNALGIAVSPASAGFAYNPWSDVAEADKVHPTLAQRPETRREEPVSLWVDPQPAAPEGLSANAWVSVQEQIRQAEYHYTWHAPSDAYVAPNRANGWRTAFDASGVQVAPRISTQSSSSQDSEEDATWQWSLTLTGFGYAGHLQTVAGSALPVTKDNRVEFRWGDDLVEWYINDERGLEQGFTIARPPAGEPGDGSPLQIEMALHSTLVPELADGGQSLLFRDADGRTILRYGYLLVTDATGRQLDAHLELDTQSTARDTHHVLRITLADAVVADGAVYPIVVDPLLTSQLKQLTASDGAAYRYFGSAVAISGDTIVVGKSDTSQGAVYVFVRNQGGPDNWGEVKRLTASDGAGGDNFGRYLSIDGDTLVVASWQETGLGAAYVFERNQGGADNWGEVKKFMSSDEVAGDNFGQSVSISGDTIVVGAADDDGKGSAFIFARNQGGADNWGQVAKLVASDGVAEDHFGYSVSISGDTIVVGAFGDDAEKGSAYVFERNQGGADAWGQVAKLTASDGAADDWFGESVSISEDVIVAGALFDDVGANNWQGSAYVFARNQGGADAWGQVTKLTASDGAANDTFGANVSLSGDTIGVTAEGDTIGANNYQGSAYIFARNAGGADNWGQVKKLIASDGAGSDRFGSSVSIGEDTIVVGAEYDDVGANTNQGSAYLFVRRGNTWGQQSLLVAPDGARHFGESASVDGDTLVVGASWASVGGDDRAGAAYVFTRNQDGIDGWGFVKQLTASDGAAYRYFGSAVAISGDTIVVGKGDTSQGAAYVFKRNQGGADNWGQVKRLTASDGAAGDNFGRYLSIDGDTLVVVSWQETGLGAAYVFERNQGGPDNWGEVKKLMSSDEVAGDNFGQSVSISGDTILVGAADDDGKGSAFIFARNQGGADNWGQVAKLVASDGVAEDHFGYSVSISGDTIAVGAFGDDAERGAAYVFERNQGGADNWGQVTKLTASDGAADDWFGTFVSISEGVIVVGALFDDIGANDRQGSAYVFVRNQGGADAWGQVTKLTASDGAGWDCFGHGVSVSGNNIVVGANLKSAAYVYRWTWLSAMSDSYTTDEDVTLTVPAPGVLGNDSGGDGVTLNIITDTTPAHGTLTLNADGSFVYTPAPLNYNGTDSFAYHISDGLANSDVVTVTITITPVNDAPVAIGDSYTTTEEIALIVPAPGVLGNDGDPDGTTPTAVKESDPAHGALALNADGSFTYTPVADYAGVDSFAYRAYDGALYSSAATVTLTVLGANDPPAAADDGYTASEDITLSVPAPGVLDNDSDVDGDPLTAVRDTDPLTGTLTLAANGSFFYVPPLDYSGVVTFTYHAYDGLADSNVATVAITVTAVNDPPVAAEDGYTTDKDTPLWVAAPGVLGNDSDVEDDALTAVKDADPAHGTLTLDADGAFVYTPTVDYTGQDHFTYHAYDGAANSNVTTVTITINAPPVADDISVFTLEETPLVIAIIPGHASDPDGDPLTVTAVGTPPTGTTAISGTTGAIYTPTLNFSGTVAFAYTVADPRGLTDTATITVTVGGLNDPPVAVDDAITIDEDTLATIDVLNNDSDPDGQTPFLVAVGAPAAGTTSIVGNAVRYAPPPDFYGIDTFTYTIGDGALTATATVAVAVDPVEDAPTLDPIPDLPLEPGAGPQVVDLSGIGSGAANEIQTLAVTASSSNPGLIPHPTVAYVSPDSTGALSFTPVAGQTGAATIAVTVTDGVSQTVRSFHVTVWSATGPVAYVAAGETGLVVVDLSRPDSPRRIGLLDTPGEARDVVISGTNAYVADGPGGLLIVDISTPTDPRAIGALETPGFANGVAVSDPATGPGPAYAFVADGYAGVQMIDVSDPGDPQLVSTSNTPGYASKVAASGHYVYVADGPGGLRILDTLAPLGQATACDMAGNCTTVAATIVSGAMHAAAPAQAPSLGVSILNVPPVLNNTDPITITGKAFAHISSLRMLTVTVDSGVIYTQTWSSGAVTKTTWTAPWTLTSLADGAHALRADIAAWDGAAASDALAVVLDTQPPAVSITSLELTSTHYHAPNALDLSGLVADTGGVNKVQVTVGQDVYNASITDGTWHTSWYLGTGPLPDNQVYTITAQATDVAGRTTRVTETVIADVVPPAPVVLTMSSHSPGQTGSSPVVPGATLRTISPTLTLTWTESSDGSGLGDYLAGWTSVATSTQYTMHHAQYPTRTSQFTPGEGQKVSAQLGSQDIHGQQTWQSLSPVYVDSPHTPDYVVLNDPDGVYRGWMDSGCALVGVDRRVNRSTSDRAALNAEQAFYATWNTEALRLAWTGASWETDGDLFVYLDVRAGGAITAFNPYLATVTNTVIYLPGVTPTSTVDAMAADYLIWVRDSTTAVLLQWQAARWDFVTALPAGHYRYDAIVNGGQTDLYLPFDLIGLAAGGSLDVVAFASEQDALRLWAVMPNANPVSSARVVETSVFVGEAQTFALSRRYHWASLGAGICPNGSDGSTPARYPDTDLQVRVTVEPVGVVYGFLDSNLFWLWDQLSGDKTADVSSLFSFMSTDHPRVGGNQQITYTIHYRNRGTDAAAGAYADISAHYALRLAPGDGHRVVDLGNIGPGAEGTIAFQGLVDLSKSALPWAAVTVQVYDAAHDPSGPPLDRIWVDHQVDRDAPRFFGIQQPGYVISAGPNTLRGYAYDDSPVPAVTLNVQGHSPVTCPDATPQDGQWSCILDATGSSDGDIFGVSLQATDAFGQASSTSAARNLIVDTVPPTVTLNLTSTQVIPGSVVKGGSYKLLGYVSDNHGLGRVEACVAGVCAPANLQLMKGDAPYIYEDLPGAPIVIGGATGCGGGEIVRTFTVTESFTIGEVSLGFDAAHAHRDDIQIELESPGPAPVRVRLLEDDGVTGTNYRNYDVLLDDATASAYDAKHDDDVAAPYFDRQARPSSPLQAFSGRTSAGDWKLYICDTTPSANDGAYYRGRLVLKPQAEHTTPRTGTWSFTVHNVESLDYVEQRVSIYGVDLAGNRTADPLRLSFIVDNVAPVLTVTQVVDTTPLTRSLKALSGTVADGSVSPTTGGGGTSQVFVLVQTPGTTYRELVSQDGNAWHYDLRPASPGRYRLWVSAYDLAGNVTTAGPFEVEVTAPRQVFMPLVTHNYAVAPDLVVADLIATGNSVQVIVKNQGDAPLADEFWVDVYIDPTSPPVAVNQIWPDLADQGLVWGVKAPLAPGEVLTLTVDGLYYVREYSHVSWPLAAGTPIYAQVDSVSTGTTYGGVLENHEITGGKYNNIVGTTVGAGSSGARLGRSKF